MPTVTCCTGENELRAQRVAVEPFYFARRSAVRTLRSSCRNAFMSALASCWEESPHEGAERLELNEATGRRHSPSAAL